jgi:hypothetical protein
MWMWTKPLHLGILVSSERLAIELYIRVHLGRVIDARDLTRMTGSSPGYDGRTWHVCI